MSERWRRWATPFIAVLAVAASLPGIVNKYTYDDRFIIELNGVVHSLRGWWRGFAHSYWPPIWGGDGYRPLTILAFKIQWVIGHGNPFVFHVVNIALYATVSVLVFLLAKRVLPLWAAWITGALFAVHPVHVEAVANLVGQSELLVATFLLVAMLLFLGDRQRGVLRGQTIAAIATLYAAACFSKEHAIVLPALLLACELTVLRDDDSLVKRLLSQKSLYISLGAIAVSFVVIRGAVLADHGFAGFQPFIPFSTLHITRRDRVLTAFGVVPQWLRLLYWPAHLSAEYGPPDIDVAQGFALWQIPGMLILAGIVGLGLFARRKQPVIALGIAMVCVALLPSSNFVLPAGIILAERTLFLPSIGAMIIVGAVAVYGARVARRRYRVREFAVVTGVTCTLLLAAGIARSVVRDRNWRDNETLFRQSVVDAPRAYRAHFMLGSWAFENHRPSEGEREIRRALNLFPYDPFVALVVAERYRISGKCSAAMPMYQWIMGMEKDFPLGMAGYSICLLETGQYAEAKATALRGLKVVGDTEDLRRVIVWADSALAAAGAEQGRSPISLAGTPSKVPNSMQKTADTAGVRKDR